MTMVINGSGSITGLSAGGLPDATIQQADLATGVAGTGPAFNASLSGTQSISATTWTKVTFGNERFDTNNNFASSRFTPTVAGYYLLAASSYYASNPSQAIMTISINGAGSTGYDISRQSTAGAGTLSGSMVLYMNGSTDYAEIYFYSANSNTIGVAGLDTFVTFSGALVRAA